MARFPTPTLFIFLSFACAEHADPPLDPLIEEARALAREHTSEGAEPEEAALVASALLEYFTEGELVVRGKVAHLDRRWTQRGAPRERVLITLDEVSALSGKSAPSSSKIRIQTWNNPETGAAQLVPGDTIIVGLRGQTSYALAHPRAIVHVDGHALRVPRLLLNPDHFAESLNRLARGAQ